MRNDFAVRITSYQVWLRYPLCLLAVLCCLLFFSVLFSPVLFSPVSIFAAPAVQDVTNTPTATPAAESELDEIEQSDFEERRAEADRLLQYSIMLLETESSTEAWEESATELQTALLIYRSIERRDLEASAWQQMGQAYSRLQKYDRALNAYENARTLAAEINDTARKIKALLGLGQVHDAIGKYHHEAAQTTQSQEAFTRARGAYEQALAEIVLNEAGSTDTLALSMRALTELAQLDMDLGRLDDAFENYEAALALATAQKNTELIAQISAAQGRILRFQGEHQEAIKSLQRALLLSADQQAGDKQAGDKQDEATPTEIEATARLHLDIGRSYRSLAQWQQAIIQLTAARDLLRTIEPEIESVLPRIGNGRSETSPTNNEDRTELEILILKTLASLYKTVDDSEQLAQTNVELVALSDDPSVLSLPTEPKAVDSPIEEKIKLAESLEAAGRLEEAVEEYLSALSSIRGSKRSNQDGATETSADLDLLEGDLLERVAQLQWQLGQCNDFIRYYEAALKLATDPLEQANLLNQLGSAYQTLGQYTQSNRAYQNALTQLIDSANPSLESRIVLRLGVNKRRTGELAQSLDLFDEAIRLARSVGAIETEIDARIEIGRVYRALNQPADALRAYNRALPLAQRLSAASAVDAASPRPIRAYPPLYETDRLEALILHEIGRIHLSTSDYAAAANSLAEALAAVEFSVSRPRTPAQLPDTSSLRMQLEILLDLTEAARARNDFVGAHSYLDEVQALVEEVDDTSVRCTQQKPISYKAQMFRERARIYRLQEKFAQALDAYHEALDATNELLTTAAIWLELGDIHRHFAEPEDALSAYTQARTLVSARVDVQEKISAITEDATKISLALKELDKKKAQQIHAKANVQIGTIHLDAGEVAQALERLNAALAVARRAEDAALVSSIFTNLGRSYRVQQQCSAAIDAYQQAIAVIAPPAQLAEETASVLSPAMVDKQIALLTTLGGLYHNENRPDDAIAIFNQALRIAAQKFLLLDSKDATAPLMANQHVKILLGMGRVYQDSGDQMQALAHFTRALEQIDRSNMNAFGLLPPTTNGLKIDTLIEMAQSHLAHLPNDQLDIIELGMAQSIGLSASDTESYRRALALYGQALALAQAENAPLIEAEIFAHVGRAQRGVGLSTDALISLQQAQALLNLYAKPESSEQASSTQTVTPIDQPSAVYDLRQRIWVDSARAYQALGQLERAQEIFDQVKTEAESSSEDVLLITALHGLGRISVALEQPEEALDLYTQALQTARELSAQELDCQTRSQPHLEASILHQLGTVHLLLADHESALATYNSALELATSIDDADLITDVQIGLFNLYRAQSDYGSALEIAQVIDGTTGQNSFINSGTFEDKVLADIERELSLTNVGTTLGRSATLSDKVENDDTIDNTIIDGDIADTDGDPDGDRLARSDQPLRQALQRYQAALELAQIGGDLPLATKTYARLGRVYAALARYDEANEAFLAALANVQKFEESALRERRNEASLFKAQMLIELGKVTQRQEQFNLALEWYQQALSAATKVEGVQSGSLQTGLFQNEAVQNNPIQDNRVLRGTILEQIGDVYRALDDLKSALRAYREAAAIISGTNEFEIEARILSRTGQLYRELGQFDQALLIAQQIGDLDLEDKTLFSMGQFYRELGQYAQAAELFRSALISARLRGNEQHESNIQLELGRVYRDMTEYEDAAEYYRAALSLTEAIGDLARASQIRLDLGRVYLQLDDPDEAIATFQSALYGARELNNDTLTLKLQSSLAQSYRTIGNWEEVLTVSKDALALAQRTENVLYEEDLLTILGQAYAKLGQSDEALNVLQKALTAAHEQSNVTREIRLLIEMGDLYQQLASSGINNDNVDGYEQALNRYEDALALSILQADYNAQHMALLKIGQAYNRSGQIEAVVRTQNQILRLAEVADNMEWKVSALELLGRAYRDSGRYGKAVEPYQQALLLAQELADPVLEQTMLENMAALYRDLGQPDKAIVVYEQLLDSATLYGNPTLELKVLENIGKLQRTIGASAQAANIFDRMLAAARDSDNVAIERKALVNLAKTRADQGRLDDSLAILQQILDTVQLATEEAPDATSTGAAARQSEEIAFESLALAANTLREMGTLYRYAGQYEQAFAFYDDSLSQWRTIQSSKIDSPTAPATFIENVQIQNAQIEEARTLLSIGAAYTELGQYRAALTRYGQALRIFQPAYYIEISSLQLTFKPPKPDAQNQSPPNAMNQPAKNISDTIATLKKIAGAYHEMGNYDAAVVVLERGRSLAKTYGLRQLEGELLLDLGRSQRMRRNYDAVLDIYLDALAIQQQSSELADGLTENNLATAVILDRIGTNLDDLKRYDQAVDTFSDALKIAHENQETRLEAQIYLHIGNAYRDGKQHEIALENYAAALGLYQILGDEVAESDTLTRMGEAYLTLRQLEQALGTFQSALRIAEDASDHEQVSKILINIALTHEKLEDLTEATRSYARAINAVPAGSLSLKTYQKIVDLLIEGEQVNDAFRYVQHAQAQLFLHPQSNPWIDYGPKLSSQQILSDTQSLSEQTMLVQNQRIRAAGLIKKEQTLRWQIVGVRQAQQRLRKQLTSVRIEQQNPVLINRLKNDLIRLENEYNSTITELQALDPAYASFFDVDTLGVEEVQQNLLDRHTTIIQYFILERETVAWVINRNDSYFIPLDVTYTELAGRVTQWRQMLETDQGNEGVNNDLASSLAESLFVPLRPYIDTDNLIIIPHSILNYIPFAALWDAELEQYLIERYSISYTPSVALLKLAQANRSADGSHMLALGNPTRTRPLAQTELTGIAARYRTRSYSGNGATESTLRTAINPADFAHLAISGDLPTEQVLFGRFELREESSPISATGGLRDANDGWLGIYELYEMDLPQTNLVVFSDSATTVDRVSNGEEILELQRAIHHAGVPSLFYSLWRVEDEARAEFFDRFYLGLQEQLAPTKALRLAQLHMLEESKTSAPYYWAAFTLAGDYEGVGRSLDTEPLPTSTPIPTPEPTPTPFILPPVWNDKTFSPNGDTVAVLMASPLTYAPVLAP